MADIKQVASSGGCEALLHSMSAYPEDADLQATALGAPKILSSIKIGKSILLQWGTQVIVSNTMERHFHTDKIQADGHSILRKLAVEFSR